jgi:singapore isolate B (sub-type 7) whole genome shotgun sequence assembly, scaffold_3
VNKYLEATRDYQKYDEDAEDNGEYNPDDYEEVEMEEEGPAKNQPDEDGWVVV